MGSRFAVRIFRRSRVGRALICRELNTMPVSRIMACVAVAVLGFMLAACASTTELTESWNDRAYTGRHVKYMMVMAKVANQRVRQRVEDRFAAELRNAGVWMVSSHTTGLPYDASGEKIHEAAQKTRVQATLLVSISITKNKEIEMNVVPPSPVTESFSGGFAARSGQSYGPGYYRLATVTQFNGSLHLVGGDKMIWSARSKSVDAESLDQIMERLPGMFIEDLRSRHLIR